MTVGHSVIYIHMYPEVFTHEVSSGVKSILLQTLFSLAETRSEYLLLKHWTKVFKSCCSPCFFWNGSSVRVGKQELFSFFEGCMSFFYCRKHALKAPVCIHSDNNEHTSSIQWTAVTQEKLTLQVQKPRQVVERRILQSDSDWHIESQRDKHAAFWRGML